MDFKKKIGAFSLLFVIILSMCIFVPYGALNETAAADYAIATVKKTDSERPMLSPGGMPFGVKFYTKGVLIIGLTDIETNDGLASPALDSGLQVGDIITQINGSDVNTAENVADIIKGCNGKALSLTVIRSGAQQVISLNPLRSVQDNEYKSGMWVRDSTAGIGTVTYVDSQNKKFAGLGHGINDGETGELLPLLRGTIVDVVIVDVDKGEAYDPGELRGEFSNNQIGNLEKNTSQGVFGKISKPYANIAAPIEIAYKDEIKEGKAYILTTIDGSTPSMYEIEISKVYKNSGDTKNMLLKVTDPVLLEKTGGIVQGMSGSPIIQNGRLAGAVTHVMINDPTKGYGIFIENMLEAEANK